MDEITADIPGFLNVDEESQRLVALAEAIVSDPRAIAHEWLVRQIALALATERSMCAQHTLSHVQRILNR